MDNSTEAYLVFVILGIVLVGVVGQLLIRAGQVYLEEVYPDPRVANSVSKLLAVMFYLFALGVLGIISTMDVPVEGTAQTVVTRLGVVLLVLGVVFGITMFVLSRIRARRQEEEQEEAIMAATMPAPLEEEVAPPAATNAPGFPPPTAPAGPAAPPTARPASGGPTVAQPTTRHPRS